MPDLDPRLDDADAQRVIARALELQARGSEALTVAQVREIATELAIPQSAVDQALAEFRAAATERSARAALPAERPRRQRLARVLLLSMAAAGSVFVLLIVLSLLVRL